MEKKKEKVSVQSTDRFGFIPKGILKDGIHGYTGLAISEPVKGKSGKMFQKVTFGTFGELNGVSILTGNWYVKEGVYPVAGEAKVEQGCIMSLQEA